MKKFVYYSILFLTALVMSCSEIDNTFEELNTDTKNPAEVTGETLFTNGTRNFFDLMLETNVNRNVFRLYAQYWAQTTYPDESQYNQVTRNIPDNMWTIIYRDVLKDLDGAKMLIEEQETASAANPQMAEGIKQNKLAAISIMEAFAYTTLVDIFGNIPYTEALDVENPSPGYDDAATVYNTAISKLDDAISKINADYVGYANQDPIYQGDMGMWLKAANSLKLILAMRLADVDASKSKSMAEAAASNLISSNNENFAITYYSSSPNTHPLWVDLVASGRNDFVPANTLVNIMNDLEDPRRQVYFNEYEGGYLGGIYGDANAASSFSQLGDILKDPALPGILISYAEVEFLLAEAVERGYNVGGTAEEHYNNGILASMNEWDINTDEALDYVSKSEVAYDSAEGDWKQKIGIQKWIAMYNLPFEGWTVWRLLDFNALTPPPDMAMGDIPVRFIYPIEEAVLNGTNYDEAASAIGGDTKTTKLFWDVN